jgi:hypothetical protein
MEHPGLVVLVANGTEAEGNSGKETKVANKGFEARRTLLADAMGLVEESLFASTEDHPVVMVLDMRDRAAQRIALLLGEEQPGRHAEAAARLGSVAVMVCRLGRDDAVEVMRLVAGKKSDMLAGPRYYGQGYLMVVAAGGVHGHGCRGGACPGGLAVLTLSKSRCLDGPAPFGQVEG